MINQQALIIGASSDIAKAIACHLMDDLQTAVTLISRDLCAYSDIKHPNVKGILVSDYSESSIEGAVIQITSTLETPITQVFICLGMLHDEHIQPEKQLKDINSASFEQLMAVNALTPMLWVKALLPALKGKADCRLVVLSARVGSIKDNKLGGWYSYRASKAALNMMLKSAAIELSRRAKNIKIIAFHPGTTDTSLSKPFQKNVPEGKLFTPQFVATQLFSILKESKIDGTASFLDWKGDAIDW